MGPPSYMRPVVDWNVVMRRIPVHSYPTTRRHFPRGSKLHGRRGDKIPSITQVTVISYWCQVIDYDQMWTGADACLNICRNPQHADTAGCTRLPLGRYPADFPCAG